MPFEPPELLPPPSGRKSLTKRVQQEISRLSPIVDLTEAFRAETKKITKRLYQRDHVVTHPFRYSSGRDCRECMALKAPS